MKVLFLSLICLVAFTAAVVAQSDLKLKIGAKIPYQYLPTEDETAPYIATHPSQFRPFIKKTIAGVTYTVAYDEESRKIRYIHTIDRTFRTKSGLSVGSKIVVTQKQVYSFGGWYTFAGKTSDGWQIISAEDETSLGEWKQGETKTITIGGFSKGGN
ncbi:MAG: hypothetical protein IPL32_01435 [Chloracidobacterium sp.]|nr:hypothetical protein [Chloracidobacterium sp.]